MPPSSACPVSNTEANYQLDEQAPKSAAAGAAKPTTNGLAVNEFPPMNGLDDDDEDDSDDDEDDDDEDDEDDEAPMLDAASKAQLRGVRRPHNMSGRPAPCQKTKACLRVDDEARSSLHVRLLSVLGYTL